MRYLKYIAASLAAASAAQLHAQTLFGVGGPFIPSQPGCAERLPDQCLVMGDETMRREAAAKGAYVVPAVEANSSWDTIHRINAMLARRRSGVTSSRDLTVAANGASDEMKALRTKAAGDYKLPYLSAGMNGLLGAAAGTASPGWQILAKPAAAVGAEIATDTLNHIYTDYTRPERQYELFQRNLDAELNSSETLATAFAVAKRDPQFARALDLELRDFGVTTAMTPDQTYRSVTTKFPSLGIADLKNEIAKDDAALEAGLSTQIQAAGSATIDALKQEFVLQAASAAAKAAEEQKLAAIELRRQTAHEAVEGGLMLAVQIVGISDPQAAAGIQTVGSSALKIYDTVDHFSTAIHNADKLTSTLGAAAMTANIAVIGLALVSSFANQGPDSSTIILQQIQAIQQQLTELRKVVDDHFLQTDMRLASMTQVMVDNFAQIHSQLATGNFDQKAIYDKTDQVLSTVQALSAQIDDRFQAAIDILAAPDMICFSAPVNYPDLKKHFNQLLSVQGQCLSAATKMVTKEAFTAAVTGNDVDPSTMTADAILSGMSPGSYSKPVPDWHGIKVKPLQMAAVADGLSSMPTSPVPDPASWMAYASQYVNFSLSFEPIRRKLAVNPLPQTNAVIDSGRSLALFYDALRPSPQAAKFYYKRLAALQRADSALLGALVGLRRDFEASDGLNGWSFEELKWLSGGGIVDEKPTIQGLKFSSALRPGYENSGIVNLPACSDSVAKEVLTVTTDDLPAVDPVHVVLEQTDNRSISMCYRGALESLTGAYDYNHAHDTTWFYRRGVIRVSIVASSGSDVIATRDWVTPTPVQYSADEYYCRSYWIPAMGGYQPSIPQQVIKCPQQDFLDYWVANHELRGDSGNVLGPLVHGVGQAVDVNLNGLATLLNGNTFKNAFASAPTAEGTFTVAKARTRLASIVSTRSQSYGDLAYDVVLNGSKVAPTGTKIPVADVDNVRDRAAEAFALKAAIGVYMQLGTPALFESDARLVELFYGQAGNRLLDPYSIRELWRRNRESMSALAFEEELKRQNIAHSTEAGESIRSIMEPPQAGNSGTKNLAFTERFARIGNALTLVRILQSDQRATSPGKPNKQPRSSRTRKALIARR